MKEELKTIDIKGNAYVLINERIRYFRENYENGQIITEMLSNDNGICIFKASVYINDKLVATGHAYEQEGSTFINKTSYIENCETSAVSRALGIAGIGIDTSIASYEEVKNAMENQKKTSRATAKQIELVDKLVSDKETMLKFYKVEKIEDLTIQQASEIIKKKKEKQC